MLTQDTSEVQGHLVSYDSGHSRTEFWRRQHNCRRRFVMSVALRFSISRFHLKGCTMDMFILGWSWVL